MFFEKMQTRKNDGFTLVELIVVIAILATMAGIGVPAYSGYVEKANMAADQQVISEVMNALTLRYYDNASTFESGTSVVLNYDGNANFTGSADEAMIAAYGDGWESNVALKHKWGGTAQTMKNVVNHFTSAGDDLKDVYNGNKKPTFANEVENLFDMVQSVSTDIGGGSKEGADLVKNAAGLTTAGTGKITSAEDFANAWVNGTWDSSNFMGDGNSYDANANELEGDLLNQAIANAAVLKARNTVVAGFVRDGLKEGGAGLTDEQLDAVYKVFSEYNYKDSIVPQDASTILTGGGTDEDEARLQAALKEAVGEQGASIATALAVGYFSDYNIDNAKNDALAYYAMMDTVGSVDASSDDTYWVEMKDAVSLYGSIVRDEVELEDLTSTYAAVGGANSVVITAMVANGEFIVQAYPNEANPK